MPTLQQSHGTPTYQYPKDLSSSTGEYPHRITFSPLKKGGGSLGIVALYLPPDALKTSYNQGWGDMDMDAIGQGILNAQAEGKDLLTSGSVSDVFKNVANLDLGGSTKALFNQAKQAAMQTGRKMAGGVGGGAGESAMKALDKVRGTIVNPHKAVMYTGPGGFRTFSYNFTMVAKSKQEADTIANIVYFFKLYMHPGLGNEPTMSAISGPPHLARAASGGEPASNISTSLTLTYPSEWEIQMRVNKINREQMASKNILFKIDKCFLEGCEVDYATGGVPAFFEDGGKPQTTTMSLKFKETTIMTKAKIRQGF